MPSVDRRVRHHSRPRSCPAPLSDEPPRLSRQQAAKLKRIYAQIHETLERIAETKQNMEDDVEQFEKRMRASRIRHEKALAKAELKLKMMKQRERKREEEFRCFFDNAELEECKNRKRALDKQCETLQADLAEQKEIKKELQRKQGEVLSVLRSILGESFTPCDWRDALTKAKEYLDKKTRVKDGLVCKFMQVSREADLRNQAVYNEEIKLLDLDLSLSMASEDQTEGKCSFDVTSSDALGLSNSNPTQ